MNVYLCLYLPVNLLCMYVCARAWQKRRWISARFLCESETARSLSDVPKSKRDLRGKLTCFCCCCWFAEIVGFYFLFFVVVWFVMWCWILSIFGVFVVCVCIFSYCFGHGQKFCLFCHRNQLYLFLFFILSFFLPPFLMIIPAYPLSAHQ